MRSDVEGWGRWEENYEKWLRGLKEPEPFKTTFHSFFILCCFRNFNGIIWIGVKTRIMDFNLRKVWAEVSRENFWQNNAKLTFNFLFIFFGGGGGLASRGLMKYNFEGMGRRRGWGEEVNISLKKKKQISKMASLLTVKS